MVTVTFANLDQHFEIRDEAGVSFSASNGALAGFEYSYLTVGGHDWEFDGVGIQRREEFRPAERSMRFRSILTTTMMQLPKLSLPALAASRRQV